MHYLLEGNLFEPTNQRLIRRWMPHISMFITLKIGIWLLPVTYYNHMNIKQHEVEKNIAYSSIKIKYRKDNRRGLRIGLKE